jgi:hypothetical protein
MAEGKGYEVAHRREGLQHLQRIRSRVAAEALARQRAIVERLAHPELGPIAQRTLDAIQSGQSAACETVLRNIVCGVDAACQALGLDTQEGVVSGVLPIRGIGG